MGKGKTEKNKTIIDRLWNFFSSITLAVVVFSIISLTSIIGTIIEQQAQPERNIQLLTKFVGESSAPVVFKILDAMSFTDMFHSWWFITLLFVFAANLIICSVDRLPRKWTQVRDPIRPLTPEQFSAMPIKRELHLTDKAEKANEITRSAIKKIGFKVQTHQLDNSLQLYGERGRYGRLGVYVTHFSILLILIGAVVGIFFGFNGHLNLLEGTSSSVAYESGRREIPLGFVIRCDNFEVSFYENSDTPKSYKSWLTVIDHGKEAVKKEIEVNNPLTYKGITFYQANYGFSPNRNSLFRFSVSSNEGQRAAVQIHFGESFEIPGTNVVGRIVDFTPALGVDESGKLFTYAETMNNPAVFVEFTEAGKPKYQRWILKRYPETWKLQDGIVEFKGLWGAQYTGLQVRKDPGVWIVYLACIIMGIGLFAAFFMSHKKIWVSLEAAKGGTKVTVAALTNKNRVSFEHKIDKVLKDSGNRT